MQVFWTGHCVASSLRRIDPRAAIEALRAMGPARIVVAVPVAPLQTCDKLRPEVDELLCVETPEFFYAIGQFYEDFSQVADEEVTDLLRRAAHRAGSPPIPSGPAAIEAVGEPMGITSRKR